MPKTFPTTARIGNYALSIKPHSRGAAGRGGHYAFERGAGAFWQGTLEILPNTVPKAFEFRAFLHSLRGRSNSFLLKMPGYASLAGLVGSYTDGTAFSDATGYSDANDPLLAVTNGTITAAASSGGETLTVSSGFTSSAFCLVGAYVLLGNLAGTFQLLRITKITGNVLTVRPRLRTAFASGAALSVGQVQAEFRLSGKTPNVPLIGTMSRALSMEIEEKY